MVVDRISMEVRSVEPVSAEVERQASNAEGVCGLRCPMVIVGAIASLTVDEQQPAVQRSAALRTEDGSFESPTPRRNVYLCRRCHLDALLSSDGRSLRGISCSCSALES